MHVLLNFVELSFKLTFIKKNQTVKTNLLLTLVRLVGEIIHSVLVVTYAVSSASDP